MPGCDGLLRDYDYDFGATTEFLMWLGLKGSRNVEVYGTREPPVMEIEKFSFPVKVYYSDGDLIMPKDVIPTNLFAAPVAGRKFHCSIDVTMKRENIRPISLPDGVSIHEENANPG